MIGGLFGKKKKRLDQGAIDRAMSMGKADPFNFSFDENDPQLDYMRRQSIRRGQDTARGTMDEIGRAGLLGSGVSFNLMNRDNLNLNRDLEDNEGSIYGARRNEAHGDYTDELGFRRGMARDVLGYDAGFEKSAEDYDQQGMGDFGEGVGGGIMDYWRRKYLKPESTGGSATPYSPAELGRAATTWNNSGGGMGW
jgi:hypothetical protein